MLVGAARGGTGRKGGGGTVRLSDVDIRELAVVIIFHHHLYTPAMSTVSSLVGAALFPF